MAWPSLLLALSHASSFDEYKYANQRINDMWKLRSTSFSSKVSLNDDEDIVDRYAEYLKIQDTANWTGNHGSRKPGAPTGQAPPWVRYFDKTSRNMIEGSPFYQKVVRTFPKGGNLHIHDGARADRMSVLKQYISDSDLYVVKSGDGIGHLSWFFGHPPSSDWIHAKDMSYDQLESLITVDNLNYENDNRKYEVYPWHDFGHAYNRYENFIWYEKVYHTWMNESINQAVKDNVQYLELRAAFGKIYGKNSTYNAKSNSYEPLDSSGKMELKIWADIVGAAKKNYPDYFWDAKAIYQVARSLTPDGVSRALEKAKSLANYNNVIVGFDLVGGEDNGRSDIEFLTELGLGADSKLPFFLHAGETAWPDDSQDPGGLVSPLDNLYEAVLLNARRIGHGLSLYKNPVLIDVLRSNKVAIEVCPISNQILGFTRDLRMHPAIGYLKSGVQIVLASDDPGLYGSTLSMDFYQAWHAWGLRLYDIIQLAVNSINYSGLDAKTKEDFLLRWKKKWEQWVTRMKDQACSETTHLLAKFAMDPSYTKLLPGRIPIDQSSSVLIINRNISTTVCGKLMCRFGELGSGVSARYIGPNEIMCQTSGSKVPGIEAVFVSVDGGKHYVNTGHSIHYVLHH